MSPTSKTAQITQYVVYGNQTNISNSARGNATIYVNVTPGDQSELIQYLISVGVQAKEASELAQIAAIEAPDRSGHALGEKATGWLSKVLGGAWSVSKEVGTELLTEGLKQYYGLS